MQQFDPESVRFNRTSTIGGYRVYLLRNTRDFFEVQGIAGLAVLKGSRRPSARVGLWKRSGKPAIAWIAPEVSDAVAENVRQFVDLHGLRLVALSDRVAAAEGVVSSGNPFRQIGPHSV